MPAISPCNQINRKSGAEKTIIVALSSDYDKQEGPKMVAFVHVSRGIIWVKLFARMVQHGTTSLEHAAAHAAHSTHARHATHTAHVEVLVNGRFLAVLLVLVNPLGEVSLDERIPNFLLGEAGPIFSFQLFLAQAEREMTRGQRLR